MRLKKNESEGKPLVVNRSILVLTVKASLTYIHIFSTSTLLLDLSNLSVLTQMGLCNSILEYIFDATH